MKYKTLSIVIPVFNEEEFIEKNINAVVGADSLGLRKEIVIVDDCSMDKSRSIIRTLKIRDKKVVIKKIFKNKNEGKGSALKMGFLKSTGDIVLVQDADLEYDPADYPLLLEPF